MLAFLKGLMAVAAGAGAIFAATHLGHSGNSVSAGMQAGPVCIPQTAHPGQSYSAPVSVIGGGSLSVQQIGPPAGPPYPVGGHPLPASWVSFSGDSQVTVNVPQGAKPGRYGAVLTVTSTGSGGNGPGVSVGLGAAAGTWLEVSVGVSPPPRAFCTGWRPTYWPSPVLAPVCKPSQPPGRLRLCRVLPLAPPVADARNCHVSKIAWRQYMRQLDLARQNYGPSVGRQDAHCYVSGALLNTRAYYKSQHIYRWPS